MMAPLKKLHVFYEGWGEHWCLGTLADSNGKIYFEYSADALRQQLEISPLKFKLSTETFGSFSHSPLPLPGFIADSLPDGWGLLLMNKLFKREGLNPALLSPLDRLAFLGRNGMGALSFEPEVTSVYADQTLKLQQLAEEASKIALDHTSKALPLLARLGGSPHGARPKVLVRYDPRSKLIETNPVFSDQANDSRFSAWLIKFQAPHDPKEVCAIEALYAGLAKKSGLTVSESEYFSLGKNLSAFGCRRFDRQPSKEGEQKIPMQSLAGALHADFRVPASVNYETYLRLVRFMTRNEQEVRKAFRQCVFNVVFNNRDDHAKNFAFLLNKKREWVLAPSYDLTFNEGPGGEHQMDIMGEGLHPGREHLDALARDAGIAQKLSRQITDEVCEAASKFLAAAESWPIKKTTTRAIEKKIEQNRKRVG